MPVNQIEKAMSFTCNDKTAKQARRDKERAEIEEALVAGNYKNKKDKVASILNLYPRTRNSDVALTIKYWEVYQDDIYTGELLDTADLFKLERLTTIARIRAKIQNEYGLFLADEKIRTKRRKREEDVRDVMINDNPSQPIVNIYADETGKTGAYVVIGSIWFIEAINTIKMFRKILEWKDHNKWYKEIHFARCGKTDTEKIKLFVDFLASNREYIGFKFVAFNKVGSSRSIEDTIIKLYKLLLIKGLYHELTNGRINPPRIINLQLDKEDSLDAVAMEELKQQVANQLQLNYGNSIELHRIEAVDSKDSPFVQIADMISGAINRKLNHSGEKGFKDDISDYIIDKLDISLDITEYVDSDASVIIMI